MPSPGGEGVSPKGLTDEVKKQPNRCRAKSNCHGSGKPVPYFPIIFQLFAALLSGKLRV